MQRPKFGYIALNKDGVDEFGRNIIKEKRYKASKHKGEPPFIAFKTFDRLFECNAITSLSRIVAVRLPQTAKDGRYDAPTEGTLYSYTIDTLYEIDYKKFDPNTKNLHKRILALRTLPKEELDKLLRDKNEDIIKEILRFGYKEHLDYISAQPPRAVYAETLLMHRRKEDLAKYLKSQNPYNRSIAARYGYDEDLDILVHDKDWNVREEVAKRNRKKDRAILLKDSDPVVLSTLASKLPKKDIPKIQHNDDPSILVNIIKYADKKYLDELIKTFVVDKPKYLRNNTLLTEFAMRGFPEHLNIIRDTDDPTTVIAVLKHKRPEDFSYYYEKASKNPQNYEWLLGILAGYAEGEYLEKLRIMQSKFVDIALAKRRITEDLNRLVLSDDEKVLLATASAGREEDMDILLNSKYPSVRKTVLSFGQHKAVKRSLKDKDASIRAFARQIQIIQFIERKAKKELLSGKPGLNGNMRGYEND